LYCVEYIDFHDSVKQRSVKSGTAGREARMPIPHQPARRLGLLPRG